jgi:hypothetical protein
MSDEKTDEQPANVEVPYGENAQETATLLLAAAEELDLDQSVVRTTEGAFSVPPEVADKAGLGESDESKRTTKKSAAKK